MRGPIHQLGREGWARVLWVIPALLLTTCAQEPLRNVTQSDTGRVPEKAYGRKKGMGRGTERRKALSDESAPFLSRGCAWGGGADCAPPPPSHHPTPCCRASAVAGIQAASQDCLCSRNQDSRAVFSPPHEGDREIENTRSCPWMRTPDRRQPT